MSDVDEKQVQNGLYWCEGCKRHHLCDYAAGLLADPRLDRDEVRELEWRTSPLTGNEESGNWAVQLSIHGQQWLLFFGPIQIKANLPTSDAAKKLAQLLQSILDSEGPRQ